MKSLTLVVVLAALVVGCRSPKVMVVVPTPDPKVNKQHLSEREKEAVRTAIGVRPPIIPSPPMTMETKFAAICPYCDEVNLSMWAGSSGGATITAGQNVTIRIGAFSTNFVATVNGNLEQWTLSYTCRNCGMGFTTARDQFVPIYTSVRLPIRE